MEAISGYGAAVIVTWDFGDGTSATESQVTHTYTEVGEYLVMAEKVYDDGSMDRDDIIVAVAGEPEAAFTGKVDSPSSSGSIFSWLPSWLTGASEENSTLEIHSMRPHPARMLATPSIALLNHAGASEMARRKRSKLRPRGTGSAPPSASV